MAALRRLPPAQRDGRLQGARVGMTWFTSALLVVLVLGGAARAEPSEAERAARWADLKHAIFGDRVVEDAEDAALVPVAIRVAQTLAPEIRGLYLVIDNNPSPLAAHFLLGPMADPSEIATRVRIDDYTYLHAVAETADGSLYAAARFIKAAGVCSAPASKDQALALERLGKMKVNFAERTKPDEPVKVKLLISHPNNSGPQMDQVTRNYIPADFVQNLDVTYNGQSVFRLESDVSISEDPTFNFSVRPTGPASAGVITAEIIDSSQRRFSQSWPAPPTPQM